MDYNKKDKSKGKIYTKVCTKKLVITAKAVKSIKMKRKRNCYVVIERKNNNEKELLRGNRNIRLNSSFHP